MLARGCGVSTFTGDGPRPNCVARRTDIVCDSYVSGLYNSRKTSPLNVAFRKLRRTVADRLTIRNHQNDVYKFVGSSCIVSTEQILQTQSAKSPCAPIVRTPSAISAGRPRSGTPARNAPEPGAVAKAFPLHWSA